MIAASEIDANLYYATKFLAPDAFVFVQTRGKKHLLMNDLEVDRAKSESKVDQVHSTSRLAQDYYNKYGKRPYYLDLIGYFLKKQKAKSLEVPGNFPLDYADALRKRGFKITPIAEPFFQARTIKSKAEIKAVTQAIRYTEAAIRAAIATLKKSIIKRGKLYLDGGRLTSEDIKKIINVKLMESGCIAANSIVACGEDAVDPHNQGSGPLYAHQSIIMDIFPRDSNSRYHADITRTVCRGKASPKLKKMYDAVRDGQALGVKAVRQGADGAKIHKAIQKLFEDRGYQTGVQKGRMQGFFHGTGHGLGLDIHELPRIGGVKDILKAGQIVTVEPGLYYSGIGGVRLEDDVLVTKTGCINLVKLPKVLEI